MALNVRYATPGGGESFDYTVDGESGPQDISEWRVTAKLVDPTGVLEPEDITVEKFSAGWRILVSGDQTEARRGSRAIVSAVGVAPSLPDLPFAQEYLLVVHS